MKSKNTYYSKKKFKYYKTYADYIDEYKDLTSDEKRIYKTQYNTRKRDSRWMRQAVHNLYNH